MMVSLLVVGVLASQGVFAEGNGVSGGGCFSLISNSDVLVASAQVQIERSDGNQFPKQGETFRIVINVRGEEGIGTCGSVVAVRPGFELPAGFALVEPTGVLGDAPLNCFLGTPPNLARQFSCPTAPTDIAADGALLFDKTTGLWPLREGQVLQISVPVMSTTESTPTLRGHLEYTAFDGSDRVLHPTVGGRVFFNPPTITYPSPSTTLIGPYEATLAGFVDTHFNAGTLLVELKVGASGAFTVFDSVAISADNFANDIDLVAEDLDADTDHAWRFTFDPARANTANVVGADQSFRTLPPPRFAYDDTVVGGGAITTNPAPESDGTFIDRTDVTLTAVPSNGQRLVSFVVNGANVVGASTTVHVEAPLTARATFEAIPAPDGEGEGEEGEGDGVIGGEGEGDEGEGDVGDEGEGDGPAPPPPPDDGEGEGDVGDEGEGDGGGDDEEEDGGGGVVDGCGAGVPGSAFVLLCLLRRRRR